MCLFVEVFFGQLQLQASLLPWKWNLSDRQSHITNSIHTARSWLYSYLLIVPASFGVLSAGNEDREGQAPYEIRVYSEAASYACCTATAACQTLFSLKISWSVHSHDSESFPKAVIKLLGQSWGCHKRIGERNNHDKLVLTLFSSSKTFSVCHANRLINRLM